ncbi:UDP-N-acetylglucosamine 2-epimerase (non-hydrolyzing) [soil metagenome]
MLHILTVIGARPQIIKAAALSRAIRAHFQGQLKETIVHTGQHYDENMSQVFFEELLIPSPDYNLQIGSQEREVQIKMMVEALEELILLEKPGAILVYGDTNSTKAGAEAGKKLNIPVVHIEAGMRSFNLDMPEEINRVYCDQVSSLLFSPTKTGFENLAKEKITKGVYHCGDVMYDNSLFFAAKSENKSANIILPPDYFLATVHRDFNTDNLNRLAEIFETFEKISEEYKTPILIPLHPRTKKQLALLPELEKRINASESIRLLPPASFLEMIRIEKNASLILTDSGGVQKEAFYFQKPCVILRQETEWVELVECGAAILTGSDTGKIREAVHTLLRRKISYPAIFGDGHAAEFICSKMISDLVHE